MGEFFTNIQVLTDNSSANEVREDLIHSTIERMSLAGFDEANEGEVHDRTIFIGPVTPYPWIAVFDSATETQNIEQLEMIASIVSSIGKGIAISILVHDSDVLDLKLFRNGLKVDEVNSWPGYFFGKAKPGKGIDGKKGVDFSRWSEILKGQSSVLELQEDWERLAPFGNAIQLLKTVAKRFRWDATMCTVGANSIPNSVLVDCKRLHFINRSVRVHESALVSKAPVLGYQGGIDPNIEIPVGESLLLTAITHNTGGSSKGLRVVVWGAALDSGLVDLKSLTIDCGLPDENRSTDVRLEAGSSEAGKILSATLNDIVLPLGIDSPATAFSRVENDYDKGIKIWLSTRINIRIEIIAIKAGSAELHMGLVPLTNPDEGQISWTTNVRVSSLDVS